MSLKAAETAAEYRMFENVRYIVAGVSGGADSMALLHFLCTLRDQAGVAVLAAHVDHGLRGEEARRDAEFVAAMCEKWNVPFRLLRADVRTEAREAGESTEEAGRRVRYGFFAAMREEAAADVAPGRAVIATAHTLDDCTETILLNLTRGTGLRGLCGIPPVRGDIVRPLIRDTRAAVEAYCAHNEIPFMTDSTNRSRVYARNKIRLDVVPVLRSVNPALPAAIGRMMGNLSEDEAYLSGEAARALAAAERPGGYDSAALARLPAPLLHRAASLAVRRATGRATDAAHILDVAALLRAERGRVQLAGGFSAAVSGGVLRILQDNEEHGAGANGHSFEFPLKVGVYKNRFYDIIVEEFSLQPDALRAGGAENFQKVHRCGIRNAVDCDKIWGIPVIRGRRAGEAYRPAGRGGKTLKKLMNDAKIPVWERPYLPCAADAKGLIWVAGFGADERCRVDGTTSRALLIRYQRVEDDIDSESGYDKGY